jgi:chromosome segregation ATPase
MNKINTNEAKWTATLKTKEAELAKVAQEAQAAKSANQATIGKLNLTIKRVGELEATNKQLQIEKEAIKSSLDQMKTAETQFGAKNRDEIETLTAACVAKDKQVEIWKTQCSKLKMLGRTLKTKNDSYEKEMAEKTEAMAKLNDELQKLKDAKKGEETEAARASSGSPDEKLAEAISLLEQSEKRISELEDKIVAVENENKKVKETSKENLDRTKTVLSNAVCLFFDMMQLDL